jgi:SAM-dependent methyltransferase
MIAESIWHDVENGAYAADLALWEEFAGQAAGPVLELGAGTGRVALELAGHGHEVVALDESAELLAVLRERAATDGVQVEVVVADARSFTLDRRFGVIIAPMQFAHIIGGAGGRGEMLASVAAHLDPGGTFAAALLDEEALSGQTTGPPAPPPLPDVAEIDGWVYSSLPFEVADVPGGVEIRRLRQAVSPVGDLDEQTEAIRLDVVSEDEFEREAAVHGLAPCERIPIPATAEHVGSIVCVLEAGR